MIEERVPIRAKDGTPEAILYRLEDGERRPGVIHYTDIGGIRPAALEMARRLAEKGYTVLVPNVFYRTGRPPLWEFKLSMGDERTKKRLAELSGPLAPEAMERDASDYVDFLTACDSARSGPMGVAGYCFTGSMAMRTAAARPDRIVAAASFHGGGLFTDTNTSPHLVLPRVKAQLYFAHATQDRSMPQEAIAQFDRALQDWGGPYESEVYEGAYHSWTVPDSPVYNQPQAERAFEKLTSLLARTLQ